MGKGSHRREEDAEAVRRNWPFPDPRQKPAPEPPPPEEDDEICEACGEAHPPGFLRRGR